MISLWMYKIYVLNIRVYMRCVCILQKLGESSARTEVAGAITPVIIPIAIVCERETKETITFSLLMIDDVTGTVTSLLDKSTT